MMPQEGFEPPTVALQVRRSTVGATAARGHYTVGIFAPFAIIPL